MDSIPKLLKGGQVAAAIGPDAKLVLKMSNKESLGRSMTWLAACRLRN